MKGPILPWLRTIDALNTHDKGLALAIANGVTSAQIVPGNRNAIGMYCISRIAWMGSVRDRWPELHDQDEEDITTLTLFHGR